MFAVLKTGGKQYKVTQGDVLRVEKIAAEAGETVQFNDVLMVGGTVGAPLVKDAGVQAEVIDQIKDEKKISFVKRRRKHSSKRTRGHRQQLTLLRVTEILESGAGKSGVKEAIGARIAGWSPVASDKRDYAQNKAQEAEMSRRKTEGETKPKKAETKPADVPAGGADAGDDLKKLSGVGPAVEKKLHEAGVTTYAQVAAWSEDDIANLEESLAKKAEREGWVDQAKELNKG